MKLEERFAEQFEEALREAVNTPENCIKSVRAQCLHGHGDVRFEATVLFETGVEVTALIDGDNEIELYVSTPKARLDPLQAEKMSATFEAAARTLVFLEAAMMGPQAFYAALSSGSATD